ncbi:magnesium transporter [Chachezhania antarctica]|uniref:magnesium transporter n=1 Tax=Chachezhania antarctica TaxID=2340860 RepID=UPI000EABD5EE|nr:magnesium transporter [Chachezhania antarctica]|tara:strand:- start:4340 stop:5359 length:1020 start_codon:yes stop_codon:yes gene_type:complete
MPNTAFTTDTGSALDIAVRAPVRVHRDMTCDAAADIISDAGGEAAICVVDDEDRLAGVISLRACLAAPSGAMVDAVMQHDMPYARAEWTAEQTANAVLSRDLSILPVLDNTGHLVGVVEARRAHRHLLGKAEVDVQDMAGLVGTHEDDYGAMSIWADFRRRAPWVLLLAVAGLVAGYVVHVYEDALDALVILALYMPMVADTGGNVGTQSASLVTRAISCGTSTIRDSGMVLWRETRVSLMMAACLFLFAYLKVILISNPADVPLGLSLNQIALAIGIALAVQVVSATLIGAVLPLGAVSLRLDPAVVSGPALTTIVDLTGLILYFGITTSMLGLTTAM